MKDIKWIGAIFLLLGTAIVLIIIRVVQMISQQGVKI